MHPPPFLPHQALHNSFSHKTLHNSFNNKKLCTIPPTTKKYSQNFLWQQLFCTIPSSSPDMEIWVISKKKAKKVPCHCDQEAQQESCAWHCILGKLLLLLLWRDCHPSTLFAHLQNTKHTHFVRKNTHTFIFLLFFLSSSSCEKRLDSSKSVANLNQNPIASAHHQQSPLLVEYLLITELRFLYHQKK